VLPNGLRFTCGEPRSRQVDALVGRRFST